MANIAYELCETVSDLTSLFMAQPNLPIDSRETVRLVIEWSEEFEARNAGEHWIDREYLEVIEEFFEEKYRAWLDSAPARSLRTTE
jgi:hypothetical protein